MNESALDALVLSSGNEQSKEELTKIKNMLSSSYAILTLLAKENISSHKARKMARIVLGISNE